MILEKLMDKLFGFDKLATKDDVRKLEKALDDLLIAIKEGGKRDHLHEGVK